MTAPDRPATPEEPGRGTPATGHEASGLRRELLTALRRDGPSSPDRLAATLGVSRTGVVQQLRSLEAASLVTRETVRHGVGRPRHVYDVAPAAQGHFPAGYDGLAAGLLAAIDAVGGDSLVAAVFEARRAELAGRLRAKLDGRIGPGAPLPDRVRELAVIQDEEGYLCRAEPDGAGGATLVEHNCAIFQVASRTPAACEAEVALFSEVLGADVVRERHIASGDRCCTFRITPRT
jgi:predicted ArsR family transcriptional regulator